MSPVHNKTNSMKPAAQWSKMIEAEEFVPTEAFFQAVQRDTIEACVRELEKMIGQYPAPSPVDCARVLARLKP